MEILKYFFECSFNESEEFKNLDNIIQKFKNRESEELQILLINELHQIIQTKNYTFTTHFINKYGKRTLSIEKTQKLINFLYDKFINKPTDVKAKDFQKKVKGIFCPICTPKPKTATTLSLIEKAIIIKNNLSIYICKPCKLVWLTENIQVNSAQDYKKFMQTFGLKGLWKELKNVDYL